MQEDLIQPMLTVAECMMVAADLKLGKLLKKSDKVKAVSVLKQKSVQFDQFETFI
ncbi:unnamed protein product [Acanthoscelides obtectus]|nr:unnamed protein product [Acanthoscelides obtectus]CAK1642464.1 hypothetical protein AOBTE_LOCUS13039 [Acanthoscelides obtectus]